MNPMQDFLNSDKSEIEKGEAIYRILQLKTHNSITKTDMLAVIQFLFEMSYDVGTYHAEPKRISATDFEKLKAIHLIYGDCCVVSEKKKQEGSGYAQTLTR